MDHHETATLRSDARARRRVLLVGAACASWFACAAPIGGDPVDSYGSGKGEEVATGPDGAKQARADLGVEPKLELFDAARIDQLPALVPLKGTGDFAIQSLRPVTLKDEAGEPVETRTCLQYSLTASRQFPWSDEVHHDWYAWFHHGCGKGAADTDLADLSPWYRFEALAIEGLYRVTVPPAYGGNTTDKDRCLVTALWNKEQLPESDRFNTPEYATFHVSEKCAAEPDDRWRYTAIQFFLYHAGTLEWTDDRLQQPVTDDVVIIAVQDGDDKRCLALDGETHYKWVTCDSVALDASDAQATRPFYFRLLRARSAI